MIRLGERSGKLDDVLVSLSTYYDRKAVFTDSIRRAVLYPLMLIVLMLAVSVVLITQVLPIFNDVFEEVGAQMSALSVALMNFGAWLSSASIFLLILLIAFILFAFTLAKIPSTKMAAIHYIEKCFGDKGVLKRISSSKFAAAMAMAVSSGLDPEQAITLAGEICGTFSMTNKVTECKRFLSEGESLETSLSKSEIFSRRDSRLLALGAKTGSTDEVMSEIARRGEESVMAELDDALKKIEPTLVIIISFIIGLILFSVMLPLMGIMSSIG
jgi:type IV pilus assembly protein PilC